MARYREGADSPAMLGPEHPASPSQDAVLGVTPTPAVQQGLPAVHALVTVQHLLPQLLVLDPPGELEVRELVSQQFGSQKPLRGDNSSRSCRSSQNLPGKASKMHGLAPQQRAGVARKNGMQDAI